MRYLTRMIMPILLVLGLIAGQAGAVLAQDDDTTITVGSKNFTEQLILGEMLALILEDAGYEVDRQLNLGGTAVVHQGLVSDEVDVYVEYTGTGLVALLGLPVPGGENGGATPASAGDGEATPVGSVAEQAYDIVAEAYPEEFGAVWLDQIGFNNTYAIVVTSETAEGRGLETISDLQGHASELTLGSEPEFPVREDGLPGLESTYDFSFSNVVTMDAGLLYAAVDSGEVDAITATSTDGRIPALDLVILEDDMDYFPPYYAAPVVRQEVLEANPELEELLNQLAGTIDNQSMAEMNYQVDEEGAEPIDVARTFLEEQGIIEATD